MKAIEEMTRAQAQARIALLSDSDEIAAFAKHPNKHIVSYASYKLKRLRERPAVTEAPADSAAEVMTASNDSVFDELVRRFTEEGKPDPKKSARASIAAKAQAAKRKAAKENAS
jgi:hypothetical protein